MDAFADYTIEKKNEAVAHGKKLLRDADGKLKEFERDRRVHRRGQDGRPAADRMKAQPAEASRRLDEMGKASAASWDKAKQGFTDGFKDLQQGFEKAVAVFK